MLFLEDDSSGFIGRSPEYSGATLVCFKDAFYNLALECILLVIIQKFGPKAARVFKYVLHLLVFTCIMRFFHMINEKYVQLYFFFFII